MTDKKKFYDTESRRKEFIQILDSLAKQYLLEAETLLSELKVGLEIHKFLRLAVRSFHPNLT